MLATTGRSRNQGPSRETRAALLLLAVSSLFPAAAEAQSTVDVQVAASADDAEERNDTGSVTRTSSDLEMVLEAADQTVGVRFLGVTIPQGATIVTAYVQFTADQPNLEATSLTIEGQDADNAPTFGTTAFGISTRPRTTAATFWSPAGWTTAGESGAAQRTPDLSAVVQEIVNRPGWASGNALVLVISGTGKRVAKSWDGAPGAAPLLHVEYSVTGNTPPTVSISAPPNGQTVSDTDVVVFNGSASDAQDGNLTASLSWSSSRDGIIGSGGSFSTSALSVGTHTITASVTDSDGASGQAQISITVNASTAPVIVAAGDIAGCAWSGDEQTAALLDSIPGTVLALGDNAYENGSTAEFANCYGPSWGRHKARTKAAAGNHEYVTPNAAPYYAYFGPAASGDPTKGYYSFEIGSWHVVVLNSECSAIGGCTASSPQGLWLQNDLATHPASCTLAMAHHPPFSSSGSSSSLAPLWQILQNAGADVWLVGHRHNYERFAKQDWNGNSDPAGIREFVVGTGGSGIASFGTILPNSEVRGSARGVLKMTLKSTSYDWQFVPVAGQSFTDSGSASCVGITQNTAPSVTITAPPNGSSFAQGTAITFTGTANDAQSGNLSSSINWSSSINGSLGTGSSRTTSTLSVGTHTITASATDSGGLTGSASISVTVTGPNTAPSVTITAPPNGSSFGQGTAITFTGTANDAQSGNLSSSINWSSSINGSLGTGSSRTTSTLSVGTHTITASVTDSGGLTGSASISVTVTAGNTAPSVTITAPPNGSSFSPGTAVTFTGTASDAQSGNLSASLGWTSSINGALGTGSSVTTSALSAGTHTVTASVTDSGGLTGSASISVTITGPNSPPSVTITAPPSGSSFNQATAITFTGSANDAQSGNLSASLGWTSSINGAFGTGSSVTTSALSAGTHTITASVTDVGGLTGSASVTVTVLPILNIRVTGTTGDAEEHADGSVSTSNGDLDLGFNTEGGVSGNQTVGLRFLGVGVPRNATILAAWVQFQADEAGSAATPLTIHGQAADNAANFSKKSFNLSSRPRTLASAGWSPGPWAVGEAGPSQRSPDISALIQEIVTRPGWASGNALALFITGTGSRVAVSQEGLASAAALLHIEYATGN